MIAIPFLLAKFGNLNNPFVEGAAYVMILPIMTIHILYLNIIGQSPDIVDFGAMKFNQVFLIFVFVMGGTLTGFLHNHYNRNMES